MIHSGTIKLIKDEIIIAEKKYTNYKHRKKIIENFLLKVDSENYYIQYSNVKYAAKHI